MEIWAGRLVLAAVIGLIMSIGADRTVTTTRTYTITCMTAALIMIVSNEFFKGLGHPHYSDPSRLSAQIISAIGFIGTGIIWMREEKDVNQGLSIAANLWVTAILGMLIGAGLQQTTVLATFLVIAILYFSNYLTRIINQRKVRSMKRELEKGD